MATTDAAAVAGSYQSAAPAPLKVPKRYQSFTSHSALLASPSPFGSSSFRSPFSSTPTPKPRSRPPDTPAWFSILLLHTLPLYIAYEWFTGSLPSPPALATTITLAFLTLCGSSLGFTISQHRGTSSTSPASSTSVTSALWIVSSGFAVAVSALLRIYGLQSCGPLVAVMAEYGGSALGKFITGKLTSHSTGRGRFFHGFLAIAAALLLLQQGWTIESCSPVAIKNFFSATSECSKVGGLPVWAPAASGVLSSLANTMAARSLSKRNSSSQKRAQGLSNVTATLLLLPLAILQLDSLLLMRASAWWPLANMLTLGLARSLHGETHFEEVLQMPHGSLRHFGITAVSVCLLELWFGLDVSPVGFLLCTCLVGFGVRSLLNIYSATSAAAAAAFSWEAIADREASVALSAWVAGPFRHIYSNSKSRKIALFLAMNTAFMFVEFIYGFASNSLGLVSDACHMLFDCAALAIGLYASYISKLQPSGTFSYGYARVEVLSGFANAIFLVLVASLIVLESIERILDPPELSTKRLLLVSVGGFLVNMVGLIFFHNEHHHAHSGGGSCSHDHQSASHSERKVVDSENAVHHQTCNMGQEQHFHGGEQDSEHHEKQNHYSYAGNAGGHENNQNHYSYVENRGGHPNQYECANISFANHQEHSEERANGDHHHEGHSHQGFEHDLPETVSGHRHHHYEGHGHSGPGCDHDDRHHEGHGHSEPGCNHQDEGHGHLGAAYHRQHEDHSHSAAACDHHHHQHGDHDHSGAVQLENNVYSGGRHHQTASCDHHHHHHHQTGSGHHHHHHEDHDHSATSSEQPHRHIDHNMQGIFLHVLADTLGSVGVIISSALIQLKGWTLSDAACSIFISVMIIATAIPLLKNSAEILLQRTPRSIEKRLQEALGRIRNVPGLGGLERLHTWNLTNEEIIGSLRLHAAADADKQLLRAEVSRILHEAGIRDLSVQVEDIM